MKVSELISALEKCDKDHDVAITVPTNDDRQFEVLEFDSIDNEDSDGPVLIHIKL